jgi:hypothetical protein
MLSATPVNIMAFSRAAWTKKCMLSMLEIVMVFILTVRKEVEVTETQLCGRGEKISSSTP